MQNNFRICDIYQSLAQKVLDNLVRKLEYLNIIYNKLHKQVLIIWKE